MATLYTLRFILGLYITIVVLRLFALLIMQERLHAIAGHKKSRNHSWYPYFVNKMPSFIFNVWHWNKNDALAYYKFCYKKTRKPIKKAKSSTIPVLGVQETPKSACLT